MNTPFALLMFGFLLGMRHATDADHVVAVTTLVARERRMRGALLLGAIWGVGHTATLLAIGVPIMLFGLVVPERLGLGLEFSVALMLILLGVLNLAEFFRRLHRAPARSHGHSHAPAGDPERSKPERGAWRSLIVGIVHGLAGSAAVALLVLSEVKSVAWGVLYLLLFGAGTIAGMACFTGAVALPMSFASARSERLQAHFGWISGLLSLSFGAFLVYQTGFVGGLFVAP